MIEIMTRCEHERHEPNYVFKMAIVSKWFYKIHDVSHEMLALDIT
jgi:hypothetical protein